MYMQGKTETKWDTQKMWSVMHKSYMGLAMEESAGSNAPPHNCGLATVYIVGDAADNEK